MRILASPVGLLIGLFPIADFASAQTVREKVAVEAITVHVTARDAAGRRVEDLKASDLVLEVDGQPVGIETFSVLSARSEETGAEPTHVLPAAAATVEPEGAPLRTMIFIDEVETHPFDRKDVCAELARYLRAQDSGNREFRVARYDGTLRMATGWTPDVEMVAMVVSGIGSGGKAQRIPGPGTLAAELGPSDFSNTFSSSLWVSFHRDRFAVAMLEALAAFPQTPGRKRLLVVNGGTSMMRRGDLAYVAGPSLASETAIDKRSKPPAQAKIDLERTRESQRFSFAVWSRAVNPSQDVLSMNDVVAKSLERDVELVPIFAEGADRGDFDLSQHAMTVPTAGDGVLSAHVEAAAAMSGLANETGAEAVLVGRKAASRLAEIEGRAGYLLTFRDPKGDHGQHKISLTCRRPGVTIDYRRGYRIPQEEERVLDTVVAGFLEPERRADPMKVAITQVPATDPKRRKATTLEIAYAPPLETGASGERPISIVAVGQDRNGDRTEPFEWNGTAQREEGKGAFETSLLLNVPLEYAWSVAVRDQPTGLTSYVFVPAPAKP
jgi:VWFA-related protein